MDSKHIKDTELLQLLDRQYGTKPLVMYYLTQAKNAAARAKVALAGQNPYALGAEASTMITNIEMMVKVLGGDDKLLSNVDTKTN